MFSPFNSFGPRRRGYKSSKNSYHRQGFRLRGNTLVLLLVFFMIGLFLHYGGRTKPVVAFWDDLRSAFGIKTRHHRSEHNPYKAPEPTDVATSDNEATDDRSGNPATRPTQNKLFPFEKLVDFILPAASYNDEIVRHEGYTLRFRNEYKQADWVAYPLLENEITGDAERKNEQFQPDPAVPTGSAVPSDYTRSGYDRGHLAPAGDFKYSQRMMKQTFFMSNISPQAPDFNRGIWKELEEQVRAWAVRDKGLYIITGPVLRSGLPTIGRQNQIAVPEYYYKVILYCNNPEIRMIGFLLKNQGSDSSLKQFVTPVDEIERRTGIDFFPKIPDDLERKLESARSGQMVSEWFSLY